MSRSRYDDVPEVDLSVTGIVSLIAVVLAAEVARVLDVALVLVLVVGLPLSVSESVAGGDGISSSAVLLIRCSFVGFLRRNTDAAAGGRGGRWCGFAGSRASSNEDVDEDLDNGFPACVRLCSGVAGAVDAIPVSMAAGVVVVGFDMLIAILRRPISGIMDASLNRVIVTCVIVLRRPTGRRPIRCCRLKTAGLDLCLFCNSSSNGNSNSRGHIPTL